MSEYHLVTFTEKVTRRVAVKARSAYEALAMASMGEGVEMVAPDRERLHASVKGVPDYLVDGIKELETLATKAKSTPKPKAKAKSPAKAAT